MIRMVDLKHGIGEDLQELFHLEGRWSATHEVVGTQADRGINFGGDLRELGRHE